MTDTHIIINLAGDFYVPHIEGWSFDSRLSVLLQESDINGVNFEAPVRTEGAMPIKKSGPSLCQDPQTTHWLIRQGFNLFDCANNHILDFGSGALRQTLEAIPLPAQTAGIGSFEEAYSIKCIEAKGKKIGFLALTQYEFGVHDDEMYTSQDYKSAWMCHPIVDEIISKSHEQCDILIVLPHAGLEHFSLPLPELRTLYRHFITMGADAVVASHPHIPQPWEAFQGKPIFYSLGNFCFDMNYHNKPLCSNGLIAQLRVDADNTVRYRIIPTQFSRSEKGISLCQDASFCKYMDEINALFRDERLYLDRVNAQCLSLLPWYQTIMEMGGFYQVSSLKNVTSLLSKHTRALLKGKKAKYNDAHFINIMRCETHRWVLSRIFELLNRRKMSVQ